MAFPGATDDAVAALERDWWRTVVARVFEPWGRFKKFDEFFDELFAYFAAPGAWSLYPEVLDTLAALKPARPAIERDIEFRFALGADPPRPGRRRVFPSYLRIQPRRLRQTRSEIFHIALEHHRLRPEEGLHVGDSEINDRRGARDAGLRAVLVDRRAPADANDGDRVTSLQALLDLIG